jgi:ATP-dependent DNA helicase RecG
VIILFDVLADILTIKGIGPARAQLFLKMGVRTVNDLLLFFPRDYLDLTPLSFRQGREDKTGAFPCIVSGKVYSKKVKSGMYISKLPITDGKNNGFAVFFNQPFIEKNFHKGQRLLIIGKMKKIMGEFQISSPEWMDLKKIDENEIGPILPIYPLTKGLSQRIVRKVMKNVIEDLREVDEVIPECVLKNHSLMSLNTALRNIHFPKDFLTLKRARERFAFQELLIFQLSLNMVRQHLLGEKRKNHYKNIDLTLFLSNLPFSLTSGQKKVIVDIINDLQKDKNMNRLVQGDVGCGKTVVACTALYLAVKNGYQGAMMVPTEILAEQHFSTLNNFLGPHDIKVEILKGGMPNVLGFYIPVNYPISMSTFQSITYLYTDIYYLRRRHRRLFLYKFL